MNLVTNSRSFSKTRSKAVDGAGEVQQRHKARVRPANWFALLSRISFIAAITTALAYGLVLQAQNEISAERGVGYWLGILGSVAMLALLGYPLRKRLRSMRTWGRLARWFRVHMMLGIIGPTLIVLHMGFKLGSVNSAVAFVSMIIVAGSGIAGRYFYSKIHMGLYGAKAQVRELVTLAHEISEDIGRATGTSANLQQLFSDVETTSLRSGQSLASGLVSLFGFHFRAGRTRRAIRARLFSEIDAAAVSQSWGRAQRRSRKRQVRQHLKDYFAAVQKAAEFEVYERLFALWHVFHVPLFILLVLTAITHVIAVHLY